MSAPSVRRRRTSARLGALVTAAVLIAGLATFQAPFARPVVAGSLPVGFTESVVWSGLINPTAIQFASDGRVFVAEKRGVIKVFDSLTDPTPSIFADLRTNTYNFWDRGMLGLALHPDFPAQPYVYVLYTYDGVIGGPAPLFGSPGVDGDPCPSPPGATTDGCVVSGRLSRLTASGNAMTGPEAVLIHDWCQQYPSHSVGALAFGKDGMLYVSGGDGASFTFVDYGQRGSPKNPCGDPPGGVGATLSPPTAEGGALRSQDVRTLGDPTSADGAILRVDPMTGLGVAGNPLAGNADAVAARIIAYGLRNPFRMAFRPGTDELWVGDVGYNDVEEINRITEVNDGTFRNFGWPCYEGPGRQPGYEAANLNLCQTLYDTPNAVTAPYHSYRHADKVVPGESCPSGGSSVAGLAFYEDGPYPAAYDGAMFFADYSRRCIWAMLRGTNGLPDPAQIQTFVADAAGPVGLEIGPGGDLFYVDFAGSIRRISYTSQDVGLFNDDFETGGMSRWTSSTGMTVQSQYAYSGVYAARASTTGTKAWASKTLNSTNTELWYRTRVRVASQGTGSAVYLMRLMTSNNKYIAGLSRASNGRLGLRNDVAKTTITSTTVLQQGTWYELKIRVRINGSAGETEVWLDGNRIAALSTTGNFGTTDIRRVQIGDNNGSRTYDIAWDDVFVNDTSPDGNSAPTAVIQATPTSGVAPLQVALNASGSSDPDPGDTLTYAWDLDDDGAYDDSTAVSLNHTFATPGAHVVRLRVTDGFGASGTDTITINATGTPPVATIDSPSASVTWAVGETISFSGHATDDQDGSLPASALDWELILDHCPSTCHEHLVTTFTGVASGQFTAPDHDYPAALKLRLTATDSDGATHQSTVTLLPRTTTVEVASDPPGLTVTLNNTTGPAPVSGTVIVGSANTISAPATQVVGGVTYAFSSWSDGGDRSHTVTATTAPMTRTATFVVVPPQTGLFTDDFESGDLSNWTFSEGMTVQGDVAFGGSQAARATTTGAKAWASKTLDTSQAELWFRARIRVESMGTGSSVYLMRLITPANKYVTGLYRSSGGLLGLRNDWATSSTGSSTPIALGTWYDLQIRVKIAGASSETDVWLDGELVSALSGTRDLGTTNLGRVQIGDNNGSRTYDIVWDDVRVDASPID